jgi:LysR family hydrogen peroxide-inducible transcriptional activator
MDIKQLQALLAVSDHGSFSSAAKALATVQSNISAHIARLERELNVVLIDRHSSSLTEEGELVAARARRIIHEIDDIQSDIHSLGDEVAGDARIGSIGTTGRWLVPPLLRSVARNHPLIRMAVVEGPTSSLLPRLINADLDAAIVHSPIDEPEIEVTELFAEDLILIVHKSHHFADRTSVSIPDLADMPIMLAPRGSVMRRIVDRAAANHGMSLTALAEIDGVRLMASLAFEGFGPAIVPASGVPGWLRGDFTRVTIEGMPRRIVGWAQRRRPRPSMPTLTVASIARSVVNKHGANTPGIYPTPELSATAR